ncbi:NAD(P)-binding protein [Guyanagaster necrorhizus]|uniref:NAD(P)-binding protein n=1 Tax=Guyanagaster necrorhizus TaxID=856835 RepID=A0A9P7VPQ2_9AGAR|nr:NAD(P)-binding protein [Guyanagaster necrorhizus MCA 3950]KAG7444210.1 NAD(P)-binding protein [Guyanagaster necrorhizus MCA 3950]
MPCNLFQVDGMVVVITGAGTGIGLMMAATLENNGAIVYITGRRKDVLEEAAKEHNRFGNLIPLPGDVTDRESLLAMVEVVKARHGYIDLLVNNAGIAKNLPPSIKSFQSALWNTGSPEDFASVFATNTTAVYYTTVAFLDLLHQGNLRQQAASFDPFSHCQPPYHSSQVISISSSGSFRIDPKILSMSYTLSKSACTHLGKVMANLLAPWGIRSNVLAPGVFPSEMTTSPVTDMGYRLDPSVLCNDVPLKRAGSEEDMAGAILFLGSRAGAYMNGSVFLADGGRANAYRGGNAACF